MIVFINQKPLLILFFIIARIYAFYPKETEYRLENKNAPFKGAFLSLEDSLFNT